MKVVVSTDPSQPNNRYVGALLCAGAMPEEVALVQPGDPLPDDLDGLLIAGGADVEPGRYGEVPSAADLEVDPQRDALDFQLFAVAQRRDAPVFGICRGLQVVNVALGGSLWQDLPSQRDRGLRHEYERAVGFPPAHLAHTVRPREGGGSPMRDLFSALGEMPVNSRHHQAVKDLAAGLVSLAASPDDLVEAFARDDGPFLAAVQWHPEDLVADVRQKALLSAFLEACRRRAAKAGRAGPAPVEVTLEGSLAVVRLNRPARRNALAGSMREMLAGTLEALGNDPTAPAIVLTGAGGAFSAGADVDVMRAMVDVGDVDGFRALLEAGARAILAVLRAPKPVVAAVDGPAVGAGMGLALACDVRVGTTHASCETLFAQPFTRIGLSPDWGASYLLPALAGPGAAADLVFAAERLTATRARELRLLDFLVDDGPSLAFALSRASVYSERPAAALAAAKKNLNADRLPRVEQALARETEAQVELFRSGDLARRLAAAARRAEPRES